MGMPNTVVHQSNKIHTSQKPLYENPMSGGDADFVYNNLMSNTATANNNQVNTLGSNVQGYTMNAANLNMHRKSANKGSSSNSSKQRHLSG